MSAKAGPNAAKAPEKPLMAHFVEEFAQKANVEARQELEFSLLQDLVTGFSANPVVARRAMRELLGRVPAKFYAASLQVLKTGQPSAGQDYLIGLLLENDLLSIALADPNSFSNETAVALARSLYRMDPHLDVKLMRKMFREDGTCNNSEDPQRGYRILEIIDAVSDATRLVPQLMKLMKHKDVRLQSKAALVLSRAHRNTDWFASQLNSSDARVRANVIEGLLYTVPSPKQLELVEQAVADVHHRVVTTALLVLYKNGKADAGEKLQEMASHPLELFRTAAIWAMGETGDPRFLETAQAMARKEQGGTRRMAIKAAISLRKQRSADQNPEET